MPAANPACLIEGDAAGRHQAVDVRMSQQFLIPGVQHSQKAKACPQMLRISSNREQRLRNGAEEDVVHDGRVLPRQRNELCAGHAQQLGGASPPANLMEVKA